MRSVSTWISTYHGCIYFGQCPGHVMKASMLLPRHNNDPVAIFVEDRFEKDQSTTQALRVAGILLVLCQERFESIPKSSCAIMSQICLDTQVDMTIRHHEMFLFSSRCLLSAWISTQAWMTKKPCRFGMHEKSTIKKRFVVQINFLHL